MTLRLRTALRALTISAVGSTLFIAVPALSADEKTTRVGSCTEAKSQSKYWCEERAKVTVISFGMECENAKKNVMEACEGVKSKDNKYEFPRPDKKKE